MEPTNPLPRLGWALALVAAGVVAGGVVAATLPAGAQSTPSPSTTAPGTTGTDKADDGVHRQRAGETLLTGDNAAKAKAAALKAVPGATIERLETDADGAVYEAHVVKPDGTRATVKFDKSFGVTGVETGGPGGHGGGGSDSTGTTGTTGTSNSA